MFFWKEKTVTFDKKQTTLISFGINNLNFGLFTYVGSHGKKGTIVETMKQHTIEGRGVSALQNGSNPVCIITPKRGLYNCIGRDIKKNKNN